MDYFSNLHRIEQVLSVLDNTSYDTIEEANNCLIKYDELKDNVITIINQMLNDFSNSSSTKECVYNKAIQISPQISPHFAKVKKLFSSLVPSIITFFGACCYLSE